MACYPYNLKGKTYSVDLEEKSHPPVADTESRRRNPRKMRLVGIIGESLAGRLLEEAGFTGVRNLNEETANYKDFDFTGERVGRRFLISVKARNKWERAGGQNKHYKLESNCRKIEHAQQAARERGAEAAWLTIQIDRDHYCAYFGTYEDLIKRNPEARGVSMKERDTQQYEALAVKERHEFPYHLISNQR